MLSDIEDINIFTNKYDYVPKILFIGRLDISIFSLMVNACNV